jgi:hypothetical protein
MGAVPIFGPIRLSDNDPHEHLYRRQQTPQEDT